MRRTLGIRVFTSRYLTGYETMNEEIISRLARRLETESGKETFLELSEDYTSGIVPVARDLADVFAIEAMAQQIDESVTLDNHDSLATGFDAREILNSEDHREIHTSLKKIFLP